MITTQFVLYNLAALMVIAHFLDSAKEREWTDFIYRNSYMGWLISSILLIALTMVGIVPVYLSNQLGDVMSLVVAIGGLGAAGYHIPMHILKKSDVCNNRFSYGLMIVLTILCLLLICATIAA